jgi:2-oxoglutarate ferredoxin oxidoreductase subunit beta
MNKNIPFSPPQDGDERVGTPVRETTTKDSHPMSAFLRMERMPHIWCPTCGIGTTVKCFAAALEKEKLDLDKVAIVSGIGCTGRVAGYLKLDSFHTTHGRAIPFATGLHLSNPDLKVVVFSGDGDLIAIGGNHFIHAARRNMNITVICVNNFIYGMTGGQCAPTTPLGANTSTTPYGNYEHPFNLPHLAASCGAVYVARWTALHIRRMTKSFQEALRKRGFSFVEVITPCSTLYARRNKLGTGLDLMNYYHDMCQVEHGADPQKVEIDFQGEITMGKFVDIEKPTFLDCLDESYKKRLGDKYCSIFSPQIKELLAK